MCSGVVGWSMHEHPKSELKSKTSLWTNGWVQTSSCVDGCTNILVYEWSETAQIFEHGH
jgi:hypothetical protein